MTRLDDLLLGLDEQSLAWRRLVCALAYQLYKSTLIGNPPPMIQRMHARLSHPQVGDYVFEASTFYRARFEDGTPIKAEGSGLLRRIAEEPMYTDEEWADEVALGEQRERPTETAYYIQYGPSVNDECRWHNAMFYVVPLDEAIFGAPPAGIREGDVTVFTRDSLLGSLADAGFELRGSK